MRQRMLQGQTSSNRITDLNLLQAGQYLLFIKTDKEIIPHKLTKN